MARIAVATGLMTETCVLGGWAALCVQGNPWFDGSSDGSPRPVMIHCLPGTQLRVRSQIQPFRGLIHPDESISLENYRVATMARAAFDEMRCARSLREAVVTMDMATSTTAGFPHARRGSVEGVMSSHFKVRGLVRARAAIPLSSSRSASPLESRTRLIAELDADLPRLSVNIPLFDLGGELLGVADLVDEVTGLVVECDGSEHRELSQHTEDNRREERFERAGLVVCRVTSLDLKDRPQTVARMLAARRAAMASPRRNWTAAKPDWWWSWKPGRRWDGPSSR